MCYCRDGKKSFNLSHYWPHISPLSLYDLTQLTLQHTEINIPTHNALHNASVRRQTHMEYHFSLLLLFIPFLFILLFLIRLTKPKSKARIQIPGPWKLPLLGNLHQLAAAESSLPHEALRELSLKYGPLMHLHLGEISTVVVSSRDMAKEIMKTHDLAFVERPQVSTVGNIFTYEGTNVAFAPYGDYWRQMRKIFILELLSAKKVQSFSYVREDEVVINNVFR